MQITMKSVFIFLFMLAVPCAPVALGFETPESWMPEGLAILVSEGLHNSEQLKSQAAMVESIRDEAFAAGSLENPRIGFGLLNVPADSFRFDQEPMTQKQVFIAQKVPWFGKRALKKDKKNMAASGQETLIAANKNELARDVAVAWFEIGYLTDSLKINEKMAETVERLLRVAETRYASGKGLQQDVLQAQVQQSLLIEERISLINQERKMQDRINALLSRHTFQAVSSPDNPPLPAMPWSREQLKELALKNNPRLLSVKLAIDEARIGVDLARKGYAPDMDFKIAYGQRDKLSSGMDPADFTSASVVLSVPLWAGSLQDKLLSASKYRQLAIQSSYENMARTLPHLVDSVFTEMKKAVENFVFYKNTLMILADQWADASLRAYEVGRLEFATVMDARMRLLRFERMERNHLYTAYKKLAELDALTGLTLSINAPAPFKSKETES